MKFYPLPLTMIIFSIIEIIFFAYDAIEFKWVNNSIKLTKSLLSIATFFSRLYGESDRLCQTNSSCPIYDYLGYRLDKRQEVWRFVTYMFVHGGLDHILFNLLFQLLLGIALELVHCWWRVALVYLSGVLAGSMATSFTQCPGLIGASGGVYALITAHIATIFMNWRDMEYAIPQLFFILILCCSNIASQISQHLLNPNNNIGYTSHLSGGFAGLLVGIGVLRNLNVRPYERTIWFVAVGIYAAMITTAIYYNIFGFEFPLKLNK